jgi:putative PIN family toxin of toxin-antitoxin system
MIRTDGSGMALRLVLDTNVWLDWLVFNDPGVLPLKAAVEAGEAQIFMASGCEDELARVLASPFRKATVNVGVQAGRLEECRRIVRWLDGASRGGRNRLPVCRDPDDQKFLELANDCRADFLVTRDGALLVLARRKAKPLSFRIITPEQFGPIIGPACNAALR